MRSNWSRVSKACWMGTRFAVALVFIAGAAASSKAEDRLSKLSKGVGIVRACADDVWRLCSDRLPGGGRIQDCIQDKMGQLSKDCVDALVDAMADQSFTICKNQPYALCAAARCNVYDGVAYCQCEKKSGDSISLTFKMAEGEDVCSAMTAGAQNQYLVSTYSLPDSIVAQHGDRAIYSCPGGEAAGAYAQCDGGLCFTSTEGTTFLGFDKPVPKGQIICSCPITNAKPNSAAQSYQILGPYPCDKSFFQYCKVAVANGKTGSTIFVGAPTGTAQGLAVKLNGSVPPLNECRE